MVRCALCKMSQVADELPTGWRIGPRGVLCVRCADIDASVIADEVLEEEILYPSSGDTLDEDFVEEFVEDCSMCGGPCQGH